MAFLLMTAVALWLLNRRRARREEEHNQMKSTESTMVAARLANLADGVRSDRNLGAQICASTISQPEATIGTPSRAGCECVMLSEAAEYLHCAQGTLENWISAKKFHQSGRPA
jgi:hypothetical protein